MSAFTESVVEKAALDWLGALGYSVLHGPEIAAGAQFVQSRVSSAGFALTSSTVPFSICSSSSVPSSSRSGSSGTSSGGFRNTTLNASASVLSHSDSFRTTTTSNARNNTPC